MYGVMARILEKKVEIMTKYNRRPALIVYVDYNTWSEITRELKRHMNPAYFPQEKTLMGYKIYKVDDVNEHIKVFEEAP